MFENRSDDSVRNRWNRVKDMPCYNHGVAPKDGMSANGVPKATFQEAAVAQRSKPASKPRAPASSASRVRMPNLDTPKDDDKTERVGWSRFEDEMILRNVSEIGHKWNRIAEMMPGRTEHAIRNRFSRLQSLVNRGKAIVLTPGEGQPIGISLVPHQ